MVLHRYFALTSPAGTSPKPSIFGLRPKQPQKTQLTSPASSETGVSTDEGTLHLDRGSPRINTRSHDYRPNRTESKTPEIEPRHGDKPKRSGVSSEPLVKPSSGNSVFGVSDKKGKIDVYLHLIRLIFRHARVLIRRSLY